MQTDKTAKRNSAVKKYILAAMLVGLIVVIYWFFRPYKKLAARDPWLMERARLTGIGIGFRRYESLHPSEARPSYTKLVASGQEKWELMFQDPSTGRRIPWIDLTDVQPTVPGNRIIMAAPISKVNKDASLPPLVRLVLWSDLKAEFILEDEFASQVGRAVPTNNLEK